MTTPVASRTERFSPTGICHPNCHRTSQNGAGSAGIDAPFVHKLFNKTELFGTARHRAGWPYPVPQTAALNPLSYGEMMPGSHAARSVLIRLGGWQVFLFSGVPDGSLYAVVA